MLAFWYYLIGPAFFGLLSIPVARQAKQRGYRFWVWVPAGALATPLYALIILAILPNRAKQRLREQYLREIDEKLAARPDAPAGDAGRPVPERSLGDRPTIDPAAQRSLGDVPTVLPRDHSVGDEATRMG